MDHLEFEDDGLGSFSLSQVGMKVGAFGGAAILKFSRSHEFITNAGEKIGPERELVSLGLSKVVQKFVNKQLVEIIPVGPNDAFPDVDVMNEKAPKEEWGFAFGKPQGPYNKLLILKLLDPETMDRFAFVTRSLGGSIGIGDLTDKIKIRRRLQGAGVVPVVCCRTRPWKTSYNPNDRRPHFEPRRWIKLDGEGEQLPKPAEPPKLVTAIAAPIVPEAAPKPTASATVVPAAAPIGQPVAEPTRKEELQDDIIF
jgi:hypothetical protein